MGFLHRLVLLAALRYGVLDDPYEIPILAILDRIGYRPY